MANTDRPDLALGYTSNEVIDDKFSVDEMKENYLYGIDLSDTEGKPFPVHLLRHHLNAAISYISRLLTIQITESEEEEYHDYHASDYKNWGFMQLFKYPVQEVTEVTLTYGQEQGFTIPIEWVKLDKNAGQITLFPSHGTAGGLIIGSSGAIMGLHGRWNHAPQMWRVKYKAGMQQIPPDLYEAIYKKAVIGVMQVWGDLIIGAGIANQSVSVDGLSQSMGTTQSAMFGGASARAEEYRKDIELLLPALKMKYMGIRMTVV